MLTFKKSSGYVVLEASIVFPILIFLFVAIIGVSAFMLKNIVFQGERHMLLREEAGKVSGNLKVYSNKDINRDINVREIKKGLDKTLVSDFDQVYINIFKGFNTFKLSGSDQVYVIDEERKIKLYEVFK